MVSGIRIERESTNSIHWYQPFSVSFPFGLMILSVKDGMWWKIANFYLAHHKSVTCTTNRDSVLLLISEIVTSWELMNQGHRTWAGFECICVHVCISQCTLIWMLCMYQIVKIRKKHAVTNHHIWKCWKTIYIGL